MNNKYTLIQADINIYDKASVVKTVCYWSWQLDKWNTMVKQKTHVHIEILYVVNDAFKEERKEQLTCKYFNNCLCI